MYIENIMVQFDLTLKLKFKVTHSPDQHISESSSFRTINFIPNETVGCCTMQGGHPRWQKDTTSYQGPSIAPSRSAKVKCNGAAGLIPYDT